MCLRFWGTNSLVGSHRNDFDEFRTNLGNNESTKQLGRENKGRKEERIGNHCLERAWLLKRTGWQHNRVAPSSHILTGPVQSSASFNHSEIQAVAHWGSVPKSPRRWLGQTPAADMSLFCERGQTGGDQCHGTPWMPKDGKCGLSVDTWKWKLNVSCFLSWEIRTRKKKKKGKD